MATKRKITARSGRYTPGVLVAVGLAGVAEIPILVAMQAPLAAYSVVGAIVSATIGAIGLVRRRSR
jgi:integral membrane sensor domain MASE1